MACNGGIACASRALFPHYRTDLKNFAKGQLGIVRPTYDHFFLLIAYRQLVGLPLRDTDISVLFPHDPCKVDEANDYHGYEATQSNAYKRAYASWTQTRNKVPGVAPLAKDVDPYRKNARHGYRDFFNCNPDAFSNASRTLWSRLAEHGTGPDIVSWVLAQDLVFSNCATPARVPDDLPKSAARWLQNDRDYQQTAAAFYAGRYSDAVARFDSIAKVEDSPWREIAPYLAARAIIRSTTVLNHYRNALDLEKLKEAETRLVSLRQQPLKPALQSDVDRLLQFVRLRTRPSEMLKKLDQRLLLSALQETAGQDITDFWTAYIKSQGANRESPLSHWISAMRGKDDLESTVAMWRQTRAIPWLIAALWKVNGNTSGVEDLRDEAAKIETNSPAYITVQFLLLRASGDWKKQQRIAKNLLALPRSRLTNQDANAIKAAALGNAQTRSDFITYAPRLPAAEWSGAPNVDTDSALIFNGGLPLDVLEQIRTTKRVPSLLRDEIAIVVWTRAFVLQRWDIARRAAPRIKQLIPGTARHIDAMFATDDLPTRRAIGAMMMARYPGLVGNVENQITYRGRPDEIALANMRPAVRHDGSRSNWWCGFPNDEYWSKRGYGNGCLAPSPAPFRNKRQKRAYEEERLKLSAVANGTDYLGDVVMNWARDTPRDPRLPQALHMLLRSSRGGCLDPDSTLSKDAFRHLHRYFPENVWTRRTSVHY